jgi:hypothetical protein
MRNLVLIASVLTLSMLSLIPETKSSDQRSNDGIRGPRPSSQ